MPHPVSGYTINGKKIPSVTQIIGVGLGGWSKDALIHWAWKEGKEGRDYKQTRQKAADAGTLAHQMIEAHLAGVVHQCDPETPVELIDLADQACGAFVRWHGQHDITIDAQEEQLVCPTHRFGGCFDAIGTLDGVPTLFDWKSSKNLYSSYPVQLAAYRWLIAQHYGRIAQPHQAVIVRCGTDGGLRVVTLDATQLAQAWSVFLHALAIYRAKAELEAMVREPVIAEPTITRMPVTRKAAS